MAEASQKRTSDETLLRLNEHIQQALFMYLPKEFRDTDRLQFGMFDKEHQPNFPTVYVFLYDIQEDLALRQGQPRHYSAASDTLAPRCTHVRCCYLLTYWEGKDNSRIGGAQSEANKINNFLLNALLNLKLDMPSAFVQVVAPTEQLSSLGNFWQSLGDRPRLCLNLSVTVPIELYKGEEKPLLRVRETELRVDTSWEPDDMALQFKRALLAQVLGMENTRSTLLATGWDTVRAKLARLQVFCDYQDEHGRVFVPPIVQVAGILDKPLYDWVIAAIKTLETQAAWKTRIAHPVLISALREYPPAKK
ncbi:Pvc16 family protein [Serratia marcescens]|uniref:Pvc16 family protein n=1 Tax=Serratia marcescens TaxID=615 RepID=UPI00067C988A|nr:Pvc16 family protein [Serratia marcescens]